MTWITVVWRRELGMLVNWTGILDGAIVNAARGVASMVAKPRAARRTGAGPDTAWADADRLIADALAGITAGREIPDLPEAAVAELATALSRPEVQGALQALLAARLTAAPEADAARAREAVRLALADPGTPGSRQAAVAAGRHVRQLSEYFDDRIAALVADLEGRVGHAGLAQVRAEAYSSRIVALLGALDRQVAALADADRGGQAARGSEVTNGRGVYAGNGGVQFNLFLESDGGRIEAVLAALERQVAALADPGYRAHPETEFLERYQRQAHRWHGFLTPPDFDRRRRVPVADIYVPPRLIEEVHSERVGLTQETRPDCLTVADLAGRLDRTVLLGDPGGGKTTAANVLTDHFAGDAAGRIPFLVTLREYAAKTPVEWSVAGHIEHNLKTRYQCPAPDGLVERLLLTGRSVVIFDGLDELLDTSRRRDVSGRVEQFCEAYPLTPVLVTSRVVGYDQARLDDSQFTCYRLGGFGDREVTEYAHKWFATQEGVPAAEAELKAKAFLTESTNAKDLRANPLLLSLMCILYRGAGSLPGDRAGIYARCAELLLRKWDEQRDLYRKLGSDHLIEPALRYLAWWMLTREDNQTAATEREIVAKATEFLFEYGYETEEAAKAAAREFVEFCRGRMWVFSDAGTARDGEKLYSFTHRTFLEYFCAAHMAAAADSPEDLARAMVQRLKNAEWTTVATLAVQIKEHGSLRGADRVCAALLDSPAAAEETYVLYFLTQCLDSVVPSPATVRRLTQAALNQFLTTADAEYLLRNLLSKGERHAPAIADQMDKWLTATIDDGDPRTRSLALTMALESRLVGRPGEFWLSWSGQIARRHARMIAGLAARHHDLRSTALHMGSLTVEQALSMPDGLAELMKATSGVFEVQALPYAVHLCETLAYGVEWPDNRTGLAAIGRYLMKNPKTPWIIAKRTGLQGFRFPLLERIRHEGAHFSEDLGEETSLGLLAVLCMEEELNEMRPTPRNRAELPDLRVPKDFKILFQQWKRCQIIFVGTR